MADTPSKKEPKRKPPTRSDSAKKEGEGRDSYKPRKLAPEEHESYIHLRIALDSFQAVALAYYAAGKSSKERKTRADQIRQAVRKGVKPWIPTFDSLKYGNGCGPGLYDCYGDCIPVGQVCG